MLKFKDLPLYAKLKTAAYQRLKWWMSENVYNHEGAARLVAFAEGAAYAASNMKGAIACDFKDDVMMRTLDLAPPEGLVLEFGVWNGATVNMIADRVGSSRQVHGFDSFEGLPEDWFGEYVKGMFHTGGKLPNVRPNVKLHAGWFENTLPDFISKHRENIAFIHVDCDLYSSTKTIFDFLGDRLVPGSVILFDEYFNYPGWREHEYRAFHELIEERALKYRWVAYNRREYNAGVQITN